MINAAKFSPEYECIRITASKQSNSVVVSVKDNGIDIVENIKPHIFDLFTQGVHSLNRSQGGLGIGLALVRNIVEMHDGTIKVNSAGSEFIVEIQSQKPIPYLIALSGFDRPGYITRAKEMGFNHYFVKPVGIDYLLDVISFSTQLR